jgi:PHD/YefM family antitoxin component YafN of YafNO toxin-antitoxin module
MTEKLVINAPVFVEDEGRPVAVLLPIELFRAWQRQLQIQDLPVPTPRSAEPSSGFEREKAAFERMKPELMKQHPGKCVAVVGGQVVEVGEDKIKVIEKVRERFGHVSMYVQWVTTQPRIYHFPHRRVVEI